MKRREFLTSSVVASTAMLMPGFLKGIPTIHQGNKRRGNTLVVIQMSGGNDGLNTIVPYENDIYYRLRRDIAIPRSQVLTVSDELGFHPSLAPLRRLYDNGQMCVINSVGYPNPDRSHFRSMDIWQTASPSNEYWSTGWLGRYLDSNCRDCPAYHALEVADGLSLALKGEYKSGFAMNYMKHVKFDKRDEYARLSTTQPDSYEENVAFLYKTMVETQESAEYLLEKSRIHSSKITYPKSSLGRDLKKIAELITADTNTQIYYISFGEFDTHVSQAGRHANLLKEYAEALDAFTSDLASNGLFDDTVIMTFSEFGRRVQQNGSRGTDHGTANNVLLMGGRLKNAGFYNRSADLSALKQNDLVFEIDFRQIYASLLDDWLHADASTVLKRTFQPLDLF